MIPHRYLCLAWLLMGLALAPTAAQTPAKLPGATIEKIDRAISTEMSRPKIPGLSVAVVTDHELRWSNGYGMADLENFVPAKAATVYRLGSISKPITAVAAMQLVEQGKLDLDALIQTPALIRRSARDPVAPSFARAVRKPTQKPATP